MLIYANPDHESSTRPARRRSTKKGGPVKERETYHAKTRRRVTRRKVHHNPTPRMRSERRPFRRARRAIASGTRGFLGELASKDGLILLATAAATPTVVNLVADKVVPTQYRQGWTGVLAKAGITIGLAYAADRWAKQRKAALGIAVGGLGTILADSVRLWRVSQALPTAPAGVQDEISRNPAMMKALVGGDFSSLNDYTLAPGMADYTGSGDVEEFESLN